MQGKLKKGCGIGCVVLFVAAVAVMGAATWYAGRINRDYKAVQKSEEALRAALAGTPFAAPADLSLTADRLDAFLAVRDSLAGPRRRLETAAAGFARARERDRQRGLSGFVDLLGAGTDLAPVYAAYWRARNRALAVQAMTPEEYAWLYRVIYHRWLGRDPNEGRERGVPEPPPLPEIRGDLPAATLDLLAPRRPALESGYSPRLNPIELIFSGGE